MQGSGMGLGTPLPCPGAPLAGACAESAYDKLIWVEAHSGAKGLVKIRISLFCPGATLFDPAQSAVTPSCRSGAGVTNPGASDGWPAGEADPPVAVGNLCSGVQPHAEQLNRYRARRRIAIEELVGVNVRGVMAGVTAGKTLVETPRCIHGVIQHRIKHK